MTNTDVRRQIERILDESTGPTLGVIAQMSTEPGGGPEPRLDSGRWGGATSAREVLPDPVRAARAAALLADGADGGVPEGRPSVRDLGVTRGERPVVSALRDAHQAALEPLLATDAARGARDRKPEAVAAFWPAAAAYLELDRDEVARLATLPGLTAVFPNLLFSLPPVVAARDLPAGVVENSASSWGIAATGGLAAWGAFGARGAGITVGVLDSGVQADHPDLTGKVVKWAEFDRQGHPVPGSTPIDTQGHGTHVCGTIAGGNASGQWIGMAPEAELAVARVLPDGRGSALQILAGLTWAVEQGVDVLSMSLGAQVRNADTGELSSLAPNVFSKSFRTCLQAGIPVVAAMGNDGDQTGANTGGDLFALGVGAVDHRDVVAGFSGGRTEVLATSDLIPANKLPLIFTKPDISGPGIAVTSSYLGSAWKALNGTSMATPHVAGAVALLLRAVPSIRTDHTGADRALFLMDQLVGSADELGESGQDSRYGFGRLNVLRAIALARAVGAA